MEWVVSEVYERHLSGNWKCNYRSTVQDLGFMWVSGRHLSGDDSLTHGSSCFLEGQDKNKGLRNQTCERYYTEP